MNQTRESRAVSLRSSFVFLALALTGSVLSAETVLIELSSPTRYLAATSPGLGVSWTAAGFDDSTWVQGTYGVGYDAGAMIQTAVPDPTLSVYTRAEFSIADLSAVESVWLGVDYDDGYLAWLNGVEVARVNMPPGDPEFDTEALGNHESSNGATPDYEPHIDITQAARAALVVGENVLAIGAWNVAPDSSDLALVPQLSLNRTPDVPQETHWTLAGSPYRVNATLTIPRGTVLKIDPGVEVLVAAGARIEIEGQIEAVGTADASIRFDRSGSGAWDGIEINHGNDGVPRPSTIKFASILHADTAIDVDGTGNSLILIEDCTIDSWSDLAFHWDNGANGLHINRCEVGMDTPVNERGHEAVNGYRSSALVEYCTFGPRTGYSDTIDLASASWGGPVPTIRYCEIHAGQDDGIDFDNCDGYIIGNFIHGRRPPPGGPKEGDCPQYPVAGHGPNGGGVTGNEGSRPVVMNNIIYDCFHGIGFKNGADPIIINNTVVGCTWGIILFTTDDIANPDLAHGTLVNNLIWDCDSPIRLRWCDAGALSFVDVSHCMLPDGWPGDGNLSIAESPLVQVADPLLPVRADFALRECSPAIDAGFSGRVTLPFRSEDVPASDAEGNLRVDMLTVENRGTGPQAFFDIGAVEYTGPDSCGPVPPGLFVRGDTNADGDVDVSDAVRILFTLYGGLPTDCADANDANDDGEMNVTDVVVLLEYLFRAGPTLPQPYPGMGADVTDDALTCERG